MFLNFENGGNYPTYYSMAFFGSKFTSLCADNKIFDNVKTQIHNVILNFLCHNQQVEVLK